MVMRHLFLVSGFLTLGALPVTAQSTLTGPTLGIFFDQQAQAIRPIWGILGSAIAGQPMDVGFPLTNALISPAHDYSLVVGGDGSMSVVTFTVDGPSVQAISGIAGPPDRMVMSPSGTSAALYYGSSASAQILTNLPNAPRTARQVDLSTLPNAPDVIAVSDDSSLLLAGVPENADGSPAQGEVFVFTPDGGAPRSIASVQHASAIAFLTQSHDALLADNVANSVTLMSDVGKEANIGWAFSSQQLPAPDSVQASPDHQNFLVGSSTNSIVAILDASGSNPVVVACSCAPAEFRPLNEASTYQITEPAKGLLWILDGRISYPRVFFVPIPNNSGASNGTTSTHDRGGQP